MFDHIVNAKRTQSAPEAIGSVILHLALIFAVVKVTAGVAGKAGRPPSDTPVTFGAPPLPPSHPPLPSVIAVDPPPQGFQAVLPPEVIPTTIPPVNPNRHFDARDFLGKGVEGGIAAGVVGGTGPVTGQAYLEAQLDDPPQVVAAGTVRYPPALQSAGIAGSVQVQFVVDSTGHPEPGSLQILKSTHPAFEAPAREAVLKTVFRPGKVRGQAVRVLVTQAVRFNPGH